MIPSPTPPVPAPHRTAPRLAFWNKRRNGGRTWTCSVHCPPRGTLHVAPDTHG
ncbi:hypothetical protein BDZ91DRAFT_738967, partial [Kalaharituber pfeilii]